MPRLRESQRICYRADCKEKWHKKTIQSRFVGTGSAFVKDPLEKAHLSAVPEPLAGGRGWRIIAGEISPNAFHCATVSGGPGNQWKGGQFERIEAQNRSALKSHFAKLKAAEEAEIEANGEFTEPDRREVISPDGVRCFVTRFRNPVSPTATKTAPPIPDDLCVPSFLDRMGGHAHRE